MEILTREGSTTYLGQMVAFQQQETTEVKNWVRAAWATFYKRADLKFLPPSTLASLSRHCDHTTDELRLRNMDTFKKEHERMIQSTQRKMLIIETKRKYKKKTGQQWNKMKEEVGKPEKVKDGKEEKENHGSSEDEIDDGNSSNTDCDQDSDLLFVNDTDEEIDTAEIAEEDWLEHIRRSTDEAMERMKTAKIKCWIKTHRRMKWRIAMRIASLPEERWVMKAAGWNPELSTKYKTYRAVGRPKKRWEDEINDFLRLERTEDEISNVERNKNEWIKTAKAAAAPPGAGHQRRRRTVDCV